MPLRGGGETKSLVNYCFRISREEEKRMGAILIDGFLKLSPRTNYLSQSYYLCPTSSSSSSYFFFLLPFLLHSCADIIYRSIFVLLPTEQKGKKNIHFREITNFTIHETSIHLHIYLEVIIKNKIFPFVDKLTKLPVDSGNETNFHR